jgi:hypothetical protein
MMRRARQRGQSVVEFLVALIVFLPLFLGVYYLGKYADLQQSAVQASRYAAFERVMQPSTAKLSDAAIQDKMRARFFLRGDFLNGGQIRSNDSVASMAAGQGHNTNWKDQGHVPLLKDHQQVALTFGSPGLSGLAAQGLQTEGQRLGLGGMPSIKIANVEVTALNKLPLSIDNPAPIKIGASTAAWGGAANARGSHGIREAIDRPTAVIDSLVPNFLSSTVSTIVSLFENNSPEFGCHRVEFVPKDRLSTTGGGGGC